MVSFALERKFNMPLDQVWSILSDFANTPAPDDVTVIVEKEGDPDKHGAGLVRKTIVGRDKVRQHLTSLNPPHFYTYQVVDHPMLKEYQARVDLKESEGGTLIHYQADIKPALPLTGKLLCAKCKSGVNSYLDAIERHHGGKAEDPIGGPA